MVSRTFGIIKIGELVGSLCTSMLAPTYTRQLIW